MKLIIVRHGETRQNVEGIVYGHLPGDLTRRGIEQAEKTGELLKKEKVDAIFSSDLKRCLDTAGIIRKSLIDCPLHSTELLREQQQDSLNGKKVAEIDWNDLPPNVETDSQMADRAKCILEEVYGQFSDKTILFVTHKRFANVLVNVLLGKHHGDKSDLEKMANSSVTVFEVDQNLKGVPITLRSISHI